MSDEEEPAPLFYVDSAIHPWQGKYWAHLMTTGTDADLIAFGARIGLVATWIQHPDCETTHFDVTDTKRSEAIKAGAVPVGATVLFRKCVQTRRAKGYKRYHRK